MNILTDQYTDYTTWWVEGISFYRLAVECKNSWKDGNNFVLRTPGLNRRWYSDLPTALRAMCREAGREQ